MTYKLNLSMNYKFFYSITKRGLASAILKVQPKRNQAILPLYKKKIFSFLILGGFLTACTLPTGPQNLPSRGGGFPSPYQQNYPPPPGGFPPGSFPPGTNPGAPGAGTADGSTSPGGLGIPGQLPSPQPRLDEAEARGTSSFLYDLTLDTAISLTCPSNNRLRGKDYGIFFGTYERSGGLRLSKEFQRENRISSREPAGKVRQIIDKSQFKNSQAQLALQPQGDLNNIISFGGHRILKAFPPINHSSILDHLSRLRPVFTSRSSDRRRAGGGGMFEAGLPLRGPHFVQNAAQLAENDGYTVTLTYRPLTSRSWFVYNNEDIPYGKGYIMEFADSNRVNYLDNIEEYDLTTEEESATWVCPEGLRFQVHRKGVSRPEYSYFNYIWKTRSKRSDGSPNPNFYQGEGASEPDETGRIENTPNPVLQEGHCDTRGDNLSPKQRRFIETVFGSADSSRLPFEIGRVMVWKRKGESDEEIVELRSTACIRFTSDPGCYSGDDRNPPFRIEFDPEELSDCTAITSIGGLDWKDSRAYKLCPAYLSVCYRRTN